MFLAAVLAGLLVGRVSGGRFRGLLEITLSRAWLVVLGFLIQLAVTFRAHGRALHTSERVIVIASMLLVGLWLGLQLRDGAPWMRPALIGLGLGWLLNALVMVSNGAMPVSAWALRHVGLRVSQIPNFAISKHILADHHTRLRQIGDVIPLAPAQAAVSPGDVLLLIGIAALVGTAMHRRAR